MVPICTRCESKENVKLRYQITSSGTRQIFWFCIGCNRIAPIPPKKFYLSHKEVEGFNLPEEFWKKGLISDNRIVCEICGKLGAEVHHLAPQSLSDFFGENWQKWPTVKACIDCHRLWHEITTPFLPGYRDSERARKILERFSVLAG